MGVIKRFLDIVESFLIEDFKEFNNLKMILALSVYWDKFAHPSEVEKAIEIFETKLRINGFSGKEIDLSIIDFRELIEKFQNNEEFFIQSKKWLWGFLEDEKNIKITKEVFPLFENIFHADGEVNEAEETALIKIKSIIQEN